MRNIFIASIAAAGVLFGGAATAEGLKHMKRPLATRTDVSTVTARAEGLKHMKRPLIARTEGLKHMKRPLLAEGLKHMKRPLVA